MEGPTLVLLKERVQKFLGYKAAAEGAAKLDFDRISGQRLKAVACWGKHFLIVLEDCTIRIHYLMFGNYYIDSRHPDKAAKLSLYFNNGEWHSYNCAVKIIEGTNIQDWYNWSTDVMSDSWSAAAARKKLKAAPGMLICDALMNQEIFAGVGNVIKIEALFRNGIHPEEAVGNLNAKELTAIITEARTYSFDFLDWERQGVRRKKYCVYRRARCPDCGTRIEKRFTGLTPRSSFWCPQCQPLRASHLQ